MNDRFETRLAVVTGGASGIGRGIVERLAAEGARVAIVDIDGEAAPRAAAEARATPAATRPTSASRDAIAAAFAAIREELGDPDVLVNNAAYLADFGAALETVATSVAGGARGHPHLGLPLQPGGAAGDDRAGRAARSSTSARSAASSGSTASPPTPRRRPG